MSTVCMDCAFQLAMSFIRAQYRVPKRSKSREAHITNIYVHKCDFSSTFLAVAVVTFPQVRIVCEPHFDHACVHMGIR